MTLSLPISDFKIARATPKTSAFVRVVPEPKAFVVPVTWEETSQQPTTIPVHIKSQVRESSGLVATIPRSTIPVELRLDPTL